MRRGIPNHISIKLEGINLNTCTDLKCFIKQGGKEYCFVGEADEEVEDIMNVAIPKETAVEFTNSSAKLQVAVTDENGIVHTHDPIVVDIKDFIWREGYGSI